MDSPINLNFDPLSQDTVSIAWKQAGPKPKTFHLSSSLNPAVEEVEIDSPLQASDETDPKTDEVPTTQEDAHPGIGNVTPTPQMSISPKTASSVNNANEDTEKAKDDEIHLNQGKRDGDSLVKDVDWFEKNVDL